jgi:hypothetical protein
MGAADLELVDDNHLGLEHDVDRSLLPPNDHHDVAEASLSDDHDDRSADDHDHRGADDHDDRGLDHDDGSADDHDHRGTDDHDHRGTDDHDISGAATAAATATGRHRDDNGTDDHDHRGTDDHDDGAGGYRDDGKVIASNGSHDLSAGLICHRSFGCT